MGTRRLGAVSDAYRPRVFIGSSSEGRHVALALQTELVAQAHDTCDVEVWHQGIFEPGSTTLESLIEIARWSDFAVLVATPDDMRESRGETVAVPRDNVILEFGLFAGVLDRNRALVLPVDGVRLPTDALGLTTLTYHDRQTNLQAGVATAAGQICKRIDVLGPRGRGSASAASGDDGILAAELAMLARNAAAQGWRLGDSETTLRLTSPKGKVFALSKRRPTATRGDLRTFVAKLRASGLRVNHALRNAPEDSPLG